MPPPETQPRSLLQTIKEWREIIIWISGLVAAVLGAFIQQGYVKAVSGGVACAILVIVVVLFWRRTRKPAKPQSAESSDERAARNAFRTVFPFEEGDELPGAERRQRASSIAARVSNSDFVFGIICGDSGSGKTSLIRAGIIRSLRSNLEPRYLRTPRALANGAAGGGITALIDGLSKENSRGNSVLIILDQFEDFFAEYPNAADRRAFGDALIRAMRDEQAKVLCAIRSEHLADLYELHDDVSGMISAANLFRVRNFETRQAINVIEECARRDGIECDAELATQIADDLTEDGLVRPPELQIVCTNLIGDFSLPRYRSLGGAAGILAHYIKDAIDVSIRPDLAATLLRSLCDFPARAKSRPRTLESLQEAVIAAPERVAVERVMEQFVESGLVMREKSFATPSYTLVHDYLVYAVQLATADKVTRGEEATQLLRYYVAADQVVPINKLRFIRTFADPELRKERRVRRLLRRSLLVPVYASIAIGVVVALGIASPSLVHGWGRHWAQISDQRHWPEKMSGEVDVQSLEQVIVTNGGGWVRAWDAHSGRLKYTWSGDVYRGDFRSKPYIAIASPGLSQSRSVFGFSVTAAKPLFIANVVTGTTWNVPASANPIDIVGLWQAFVGVVERRNTESVLNPQPIRIFDVASHKPVATYESDRIGFISYSRAGDRFLDYVPAESGGPIQMIARERDFRTGKVIAVLEPPDRSVTRCTASFLTSGMRIAGLCGSIASSEYFALWNAADGKLISWTRLPQADDFLFGGFSDDDEGALIQTVMPMKRMAISLANPGSAIDVTSAHDVVFHTPMIALQKREGTELWNLGRFRVLMPSLTLAAADRVAIDAQRQRAIVLRSGGRTVEVWDVPKRRRIANLAISGVVSQVDFVERGGILATNEDETSALYSAATGERISDDLPLHAAHVFVDSDCRQIIAWTRNGHVTTYAEGRSIFGVFRRSRC